MTSEKMALLASEFKQAVDAQLFGDESNQFRLPSREVVRQVLRRYLNILFPVFYGNSSADAASRHES